MLIKRTMDEMITHFNDVVSAMDISRKNKITLLGMIMAIGIEYQQAADAIEELSKPRWIPVTERLPDVGETIMDTTFSVDVLGFDGWDYQRAYYNYTAKVWLNGNDEEEWPEITHWMPLSKDGLPMPPKEET